MPSPIHEAILPGRRVEMRLWIERPGCAKIGAWIWKQRGRPCRNGVRLSETGRVLCRSRPVPCRGHFPALGSILSPAGSGAECAGSGGSAPAFRRRRAACRGNGVRSQDPPPAQDPATAPNEQAEQTGEGVEQAEQPGEAVEHAEQPEPQGAGMILVSRQPIAMLASPSSSAATMYGFPAGRPFRLIGRDGGFAHIQDLKSGARGWIDEAALAPPPSVPAVSAPSQPKPGAVSRKSAKPSADPKPRATKKDSQVSADPEAATKSDSVQKRPGLFGQGGLFGGIFGDGN